LSGVARAIAACKNGDQSILACANTAQQPSCPRTSLCAPLQEEGAEKEDMATLCGKREKIIAEILSVEAAYIETLKTIVDSYYQPLLESAPIVGLADQQAITLVFGQFDSFLAHHKRFYGVVQKRIKDVQFSMLSSLFSDIFLTEVRASVSAVFFFFFSFLLNSNC